MTTSITVIFVCSNCAAGYQATQKRRAEGSRGSFQCQVCQTEIYAWSGSYAYLDWEVIETMLKPRGSTSCSPGPHRPIDDDD
jgi:hypothetical protein